MVRSMVRIKACGVTTPEDAVMIGNSGVDMIGVIVDVDVPTPREIEVSRAEEVLQSVPDNLEKVAVTMAECSDDVEELSNRLDVDYFQIHSGLSPSVLKGIEDRVDEKIIGVVTISPDSEDYDRVLGRAEEISKVTDLLLLDTKVNSRVGAGEVHDWGISSRIVKTLDSPVILAGGLKPSNVHKAVEEVGPFGVDVASGIESDPGRKDKKLIDSFVQEAGG